MRQFWTILGQFSGLFFHFILPSIKAVTRRSEIIFAVNFFRPWKESKYIVSVALMDVSQKTLMHRHCHHYFENVMGYFLCLLMARFFAFLWSYLWKQQLKLWYREFSIVKRVLKWRPIIIAGFVQGGRRVTTS